MVHDMYLFRVNKPAESKGPWDYYKLMAPSRETRRSRRYPVPPARS